MPPASIEDIKKAFFVFGALSEGAPADLIGKVKGFGAPLEIRDIEGPRGFL